MRLEDNRGQFDGFAKNSELRFPGRRDLSADRFQFDVTDAERHRLQHLPGRFSDEFFIGEDRFHLIVGELEKSLELFERLSEPGLGRLLSERVGSSDQEQHRKGELALLRT